MRLSRRALLMTGTAVAGLAGFGLVSGLENHVLRIVGDSFGRRFAEAEGARAFAADAVQRLAQERPEDYGLMRVFYRMRPIVFPELLPQEKKLADWVATEFALASNVLQVIAGAEGEFVYLGLFAPFDMPCQNPLSAAWAV